MNIMTDIFVAPAKNKQKNHAAEESHMHIFSSFSKSPRGISFEAQKKDESIILFLRPHPLTNIPWILLGIFLIFLPLIIAGVLPMLGINFLSSAIVVHFMVTFVLFYYLIVFSYILISFLTWFYNIFIVTADRIVDISYSDIVIHNVSETKLSHLEDVRCAQSGFIPTLFNYGNLYAQTAGATENFEARSIPKPKEATDVIAGLIGN
jgi:hypothetical protein